MVNCWRYKERNLCCWSLYSARAEKTSVRVLLWRLIDLCSMMFVNHRNWSVPDFNRCKPLFSKVFLLKLSVSCLFFKASCQRESIIFVKKWGCLSLVNLSWFLLRRRSFLVVYIITLKAYKSLSLDKAVDDWAMRAFFAFDMLLYALSPFIDRFMISW